MNVFPGMRTTVLLMPSDVGFRIHIVASDPSSGAGFVGAHICDRVPDLLVVINCVACLVQERKHTTLVVMIVENHIGNVHSVFLSQGFIRESLDASYECAGILRIDPLE